MCILLLFKQKLSTRVRLIIEYITSSSLSSVMSVLSSMLQGSAETAIICSSALPDLHMMQYRVASRLGMRRIGMVISFPLSHCSTSPHSYSPSQHHTIARVGQGCAPPQMHSSDLPFPAHFLSFLFRHYTPAGVRHGCATAYLYLSFLVLAPHPSQSRSRVRQGCQRTIYFDPSIAKVKQGW